MQSAPAVPASDGIFYTNRCSKCGRALTKLEILSRMTGPKGLCPCGSNKFHSSNFKWWEELFLVRSWQMYFAIRRGELAPPPVATDVRDLRRQMVNDTARRINELDDQTEAEFGLVE